MESKKRIAFLLNSKDIHSLDWFKSAMKSIAHEELYLITDIPDDDSIRKLGISEGHFVPLCSLNRLLFFKDTTLGNIWRNFLKLIMFPLQIRKLKKFQKENPDVVFYAVAMYYMFLGSMAKLDYGGTPIGSELLVRPKKSRLYRIFARKAMRGARFITVDSPAMAESAYSIAHVTPHIIQNGIDIPAIKDFLKNSEYNQQDRNNTFLSIRNIDYLYRIYGIIKERNQSSIYSEVPIKLIYPSYNEEYLEDCKTASKPTDAYCGRLDRESMYQLLKDTKVVFSIPESDSSPRSVYEAIFLGCVVVVSRNKYIDFLPQCMKERVVAVDIRDDGWFDDAVAKAIEIQKKKFEPTEEAFDMFDQSRSFMKIYDLLQS